MTDERQPSPELFVQLGVLDQAKLQSSLDFQQSFQKKGVELSLGQVILNLGLASPEQVAKVIAHQGTAVLRCATCSRRYTVPDYQANRRYKCEPCRAYLEIVADEVLKTSEPPAAAQSSPTPAPASLPPVSSASKKGDPFEGRQFGPYKILRRIAKGGMGAVYLGERGTDKKRVAIKILTEEFSRMPGIQGRFKREADTAGRLEHPNIVQQFDIAREGNYIYIVSEFVEGGSLVDLVVKEKKLTPLRAVPIACDILEGLHHAHGRGVVHRDIKPANVLLTGEGRAKVIDFGLARDAEAQTILTLSGNVVGTPAYMAPEQAQGDQAGPPADLYSTGILLWLMMTGRKPFEGKSIVDTLNKQINEPLPSAAQFNPEVPEELDKVLKRICAKRPEKRYSTLPHAIAALRKSVGLPADDTGTRLRAVQASASPPAPGSPATAPAPSPPPKPISPWDWVWAAVGVLAIAAALAWRIFRRH